MRRSHDRQLWYEKLGVEVLLSAGRALELGLANQHTLLEDGARCDARSSLHLAKEPKRFARGRGALAILGGPREGFDLIHNILAVGYEPGDSGSETENKA